MKTPTLKIYRAAWRWMRCIVILLLILIATLAGLYMPNLIYYIAGGREGELVVVCFAAGVPCAAMAFNLAIKIIQDNAQGLARRVSDSE